jgi:hypothetical protein
MFTPRRPLPACPVLMITPAPALPLPAAAETKLNCEVSQLSVKPTAFSNPVDTSSTAIVPFCPRCIVVPTTRTTLVGVVLTGNAMEFVVPPPGVGLKTVTLGVPTAAMSAALI